jgi:HEAT repeat protein
MCQSESLKINAKVAALMLLFVALAVTKHSNLQAQDARKTPVTVSGVSTHASANGTIVSIAADGPLNRAQTWQDREGYHVVVPSAGAQNSIKAANGIKVRQLDHTLEIVIPTKPGANVTVQPTANRLTLNIEGKLDTRQSEEGATGDSQKPQRVDDDLGSTSAADTARPAAANADLLAKNETSAANRSAVSPVTQASGNSPSSGSPDEDSPEVATGESSVMSGATILIVLGVVFLGGLLIMRRRRSSQSTAAAAVATDDEGFEEFTDFDEMDDQTLLQELGAVKGASGAVVKSNGSSPNPAVSTQRKSATRTPVAMPAALYGAYQVDLEVGKLVQGQPHRMDVVASRAPDDRRAIEASLLKSLNTACEEDMQHRARTALEEYGFVARQSAALLAASDPYERSSAARMLGDVKSPSALPFLLEALYDAEPLVRNQAVLSIAELRLPSAIGALLDIARKHPDVPGSLLTRALNACSLDGLDFFDNPDPTPQRLLTGSDARLLAEEIMRLEPAAAAAELPKSDDDEFLIEALAKVQSKVVAERSDAIKLLAQFSVQSSVAALAKLARVDSEASLRAAAIASLASINHESVFPAILIAMADESREVRAAAARSLSRLSFDRADAYMRVTKSDDQDLLREVAEACLKAGLAKQGIDRLSNSDHQAYEAMSVVSLVVKAGRFELLVDAGANHPNMDVRLTVIQLLGLTGDNSLLEPLRNVALDCSDEEMKAVLSEAIAQLDPSNGEPQVEDRSGPDTSAYPEEVSTSNNGVGHESNIQSDSEFEAQLQDHLQPHAEDQVSPAFDFDFASSLESSNGNEFKNDSQARDLENSGLGTPPIA